MCECVCICEAYYYLLHIFRRIFYTFILSYSFHDRTIRTLHIKILRNAIKMKILWIYMHHSWDCTCVFFSRWLLINIVPILLWRIDYSENQFSLIMLPWWRGKTWAHVKAKRESILINKSVNFSLNITLLEHVFFILINPRVMSNITKKIVW